MQKASFNWFAVILLFAASSAVGAVRYVNVNNGVPASPYTSWSTAATSIQNAIDAAAPGDTVLVADGVYQTGGYPVSGVNNGTGKSGNEPNRVAVTKPITVVSVNGPLQTVIMGSIGDPASAMPVRCVFLTNGARLDGFTLTNGLVDYFADNSGDVGGGGVWCASTNSIVNNCIIAGNSSGVSGGGAFSGTLNCCTLSLNYAIFGAGAAESVLNNCLLIRNIASGGGGVGGGAFDCLLNGCTIVNNLASGSSGGVSGCTSSNCIVFNNIAGFSGNNYDNQSVYPSLFNYCCTTPLPADGLGNITNKPLFVDLTSGDFHLQNNSPCINAGMNAWVTSTNDLDGNPRIVGGTVDMGAYEFQTPGSILSYAWAQPFGFPTDGSADFADADGDGLSNFAEWRAGTNPTNALSVLQLTSPVISNNPARVIITWQSVTNVTYYLQRSSSLTTAFSGIQSNLLGQPGTTSYIDYPNPNGQSFFYRIGVQ